MRELTALLALYSDLYLEVQNIKEVGLGYLCILKFSP